MSGTRVRAILTLAWYGFAVAVSFALVPCLATSSLTDALNAMYYCLPNHACVGKGCRRPKSEVLEGASLRAGGDYRLLTGVRDETARLCPRL